MFNWVTKLFTEDKTPATERSKKLFLDSLKECENYYKVYESIPKYKQYVEAFKEIREDRDFLKDMTEKNIQRLIRLITCQPYWAMNYPGAEKLAFQYMLRKERLAKEVAH